MIVTGNETLVELRAADELSVRGFNVCKILGIHTVPELVSYFEVYYSFAMVPNCGIKTNNELTKLYKEIQQLRLVEKTSPADITAHAKNFKEVIEQEFLSLSERSKNGLLGYFNLSELDVEILKEHIFDSSFRLRNIKNIGAKSETEIQQFIIRITDRFLEKASENENEEGSAGLVMKAMIGLNITDGGFITRFQQKKLDLFRFSKIFVEEKLKKKAADLFIFQNHFGFLAEVHTLDSTAKKFGLTRERIRQKKAIVLEKVFNELVVLQKLIPHTNYQEILQLSAPTIIPENVSELHDEITSVGAHYATFAFSALFQEHYFSLTKDDKIKKPVNIDIYEAYNASKKIKGNYLISKGLANKDTLLSLFDFLLEKIVERHSQDILINISAFFNRSFDQPELAALCTIADKEFSLQINQEKGLLRLPRNSIKLTSEFAVEALTKLGKPTHISEIIATIKADYPEFKSNLTSLRNMLAREKTRFIYFGRSSTFGLKEWEQENSSIKGGTIRDIAAEYLELFDFPLHFSSLVQYINKYRNTDYNSVVNNLKISKDKRFSFFKNGHVGLASKEYSKKESANAAPSLLKEVSLEDLLNDIFS